MQKPAMRRCRLGIAAEAQPHNPELAGGQEVTGLLRPEAAWSVAQVQCGPRLPDGSEPGAVEDREPIPTACLKL